MKTYYLLSKNNNKDVIKKVEASTIDNAIEILAVLKRLSKEDLLNIFLVTDKV